MNAKEQFLQEVRDNIEGLKSDADLQALSRIWLREITRYKYAYNFSWMGRPIIQFPQDMVGMQEIIWQTKPDIIIETGVAHGGSIIYYASLMEMLGNGGKVIGIDIDIRSHNRIEIEQHPMYKNIVLIEGSSISTDTFNQVSTIVGSTKKVLVILDSNHTHEHVLKELELYSTLICKGHYLVVFDTLIEDMPDDLISERPWGKGNNPKTAVKEFMLSNNRFEIDKNIEAKLLITVAPDGFLKCIKD
jgi:cephalosporin hydroxylase